MGCPVKAGYRGLRGVETEDNLTAAVDGDEDDDDGDGDEDCREGRVLLNSV